MIEQLFGSKTRIKLLSLFLNNPGRPFYVREITRKIDEQINSVRRELSNLLSLGVIKSASEQNKLYYEADETNPYYEPLRSIFNNVPITQAKELKETREEDEIAKKLRSSGKIDLAFLTGGYVRANHIPIDLFIVGDVNRTKVAKIVADIERDLGRELNYTVMSPEDYGYRISLNDRFLTNIMEAKKIKLIDANDEPLEHKDIELEEGATPVQISVEADN
ncbi:MAG TPA: transcriptional regulator [Candidatus Nanoarchaeia archaeon]|nr:transcriptional regulator [Candidatus Nanoarchaeia archaeon]